MAEVFRAKSFGVEGFERIVAVKRIIPSLAQDQEFISMFIDEARIAAHLTHQNIVQIYELGKHADTYFISMEYVAGRDLRQILDRQQKINVPMDTAIACFIVGRACEALDYAHRKRDPAGRPLDIIHRDVTPQNLIISYQGEVKLCDFGIAKAAKRLSRTEVGVLKGNLAYMAPEQVKGRPVERRSDIFALGVIFYEMLTGVRLFVGETDLATLEAVRNAYIPNPRRFNSALSPQVEAILMRMLAREPEDRYAWASEVHEDLINAMADQGALFHNRHLRDWIQAGYVTAIEAENAKMEAFMQLRRPMDGDSDSLTEDLPDATDPTDDRPSSPAAVVETGGTENRAVTPETGDVPAPPPNQRPVSDRFGTANLGEPSSPELAGYSALVRPAHSVVEGIEAAPQNLYEAHESIDESDTLQGEDPQFVDHGQVEAEVLPYFHDDARSVAEDTFTYEERTPSGTPIISLDRTLDDDYPYTSVSYESASAVAVCDPVSSAAPRAIPSAEAIGSEQPATEPAAPAAQPAQEPDREPADEERLLGLKSQVSVDALVEPVDRPDRAPAHPSTEPSETPVVPAQAQGPAGRRNRRRGLLVAFAVTMGALATLPLFVFVSPQSASIKIRSQPTSGANVFVDGVLVGQTPTSVTNLTVGDHRVHVQLEGYESYMQTVRLQLPKPHTMVVPLVPLQALDLPPLEVPEIDELTP